MPSGATRSILAHSAEDRSIWLHSSPYSFCLGHPGASWCILSHPGAFWLIHDHPGAWCDLLVRPGASSCTLSHPVAPRCIHHDAKVKKKEKTLGGLHFFFFSLTFPLCFPRFAEGQGRAAKVKEKNHKKKVSPRRNLLLRNRGASSGWMGNQTQDVLLAFSSARALHRPRRMHMATLRKSETHYGEC